jgi:Tol biopolymer transport system component
LTHVQKTLFVVDSDGSNRKNLIGPAREIQYIWANNHTIDLRLAHKVSDGSERQQWEQFLIDVETGAMNPVEQEQADEHMMEIVKPSPDGQWILLFEAAGDTRWLYLLDAEGNKVSTIYRGPSDRSVLFEWSPSSRYVFYLSHTLYDADDVSVYDLSAGEAAKVTHFVERGSPFVIWSPHWSPTGEWISFWLDSEGHINQPCVVSLSNRQTQCFDISAKTDQFAWNASGQYLAFLAPRGDGPIDLYAVDAKKGKLMNLTNNGNDVIEFDFSP